MELNTRDKILMFICYCVVSFSSLTYYVFQYSDPYKCNALLQEGFWLGPPHTSKWQPPGCMMHKYTANEAALCLYNKRAIFIGGTRTLGLFEAVATRIDTDYQPPNGTIKDANVLTSAHNVRLQFVWDPYLEGAELSNTRFVNVENDQPVFTIVGIESDRLLSEDAVDKWSTHMDELMLDFGMQRKQHSRSTLFVPLWDMPLFLASSPARRLNGILRDLSLKHGTEVAFAFDKIVGGHKILKEAREITHNAATAIADILLNYKCNAQLPKQSPFTTTCCNRYPKLNWFQACGYLFVSILVPAAAFLNRRTASKRWQSSFMSVMPAQKYHVPIMTIGSVVVFCWYCDRTHIFAKGHKVTSPTEFVILMVIIIAVSCVFTTHTAEKELAFLNRDQTDEWKGWMLIAMLIYNYVGASQTPWIYNYVRVIPASYIFMTGFGHTSFYLVTGDFSLKRFVAMMLRLNLINIILAFVMRNDWLLYYFTPLITWNYLLVLAILFPYRQYNDRRRFVMLKMVIVALLNTALYRIPRILDTVWSVPRLLFSMQGDLHEWRFRVSLDQYSVFPGMICAIMFIGWKEAEFSKSPRWPLVKNMLVSGSVFSMLVYALFESGQPSREVYNQKHTYVSWLPVCAFVTIRNSTPWLRKTHNKFFAWVGRGYVEIFLLQFHIWLAADSTGILHLPFLPANWRFFNFLFITPIFLYLSSLVTTATGPVIEWIMGTLPVAARPQLPTSYKSHIGGQAYPKERETPAVPAKEMLAMVREEVDTGLNESANADDANTQFVKHSQHDTEKQIQTGIGLGLSLNGEAFVPSIVRSNVTTNETAIQPRPRNIGVEAVRIVFTHAKSDLRVRMSLILAAMVLVNWMY